MNTRVRQLGFILVVTLASCESKEKLRAQIEDELAKNKGVFAVAFKDLSSGDEILIREHERFHAASTMKTPVMIEVFRQAAGGRFGLDDSLLVRNEFVSIVDSSIYSLQPDEDSDQELYGLVGRKQSIAQLLYYMITSSSNLATNILIGQVGPENVTSTMHNYGATDLAVLRGVEDQKAFDKGMINSLTAYDLMIIFEKIAKGEAVDASSSEEMMLILLDQNFNDIIPALLPPEVKVAHKTGWLKGLHHDSGIVQLPDGRRYVLVLLSRNLEDEKAAVLSMASVSKMIFDYVE